MTDRPNCQRPESCTPSPNGKHCHSCRIKAARANPEIEARRAAAYRKWAAENPDKVREKNKRAYHSTSEEAKRRRHLANIENGKRMVHNVQSEEVREKVKATRLAHIPKPYWDDYRRYLRDGFKKPEATQIIYDHIAAEGRREVGQNAAAMLAKHERDLASRY